MKHTVNKSGRWVRFGIRTLLIVMLLVALVFGFVVSPTVEQRDAIAQLESHRPDAWGSIFYDYQKKPVPQGYSEWNLEAEPQVPELLRKWFGEDAFRTPVFISVDCRRAGNLQFAKDMNRIQSWQYITFDNSGLNDSMLAELTGMPDLKEFRVCETQITDKGCAAIGQLASIQELHIGRNQITDEGLAELGSLRNLEMLFIQRCRIDGSGFKHFVNTGSLKRLDATDTTFADESGKWIGRFKNLETLYLARTNLTDEWLVNVGGLPELTWLNLSESEITGSGFQDWPVSQQKTIIEIGGTKVDNEGWLLIRKKFPNSQISGHCENVTREILPQIVRQPGLKSLNLTGMQLTNEDFELVASCKSLANLTLEGTTINNMHLSKLADLPLLDQLNVKQCVYLDDNSLDIFAQMSLGALDVSQEQYSPERLEEFEQKHGYDQLNNQSGMMFSAW